MSRRIKWSGDELEFLDKELKLQTPYAKIARLMSTHFERTFTTDAIRNQVFTQRKNESPDTKIRDFLLTGRTIAEIARHLHCRVDEAEEILRDVPEGYELWTTHDHTGQAVYTFFPAIAEVKLQKPVWKFQRQPDGQPWFWYQFPDTDWKMIKVVPIADVHYGHRQHLSQEFIEHIEWIKKTPNVFGFLPGDLMENALGDSIGGAVYESDKAPRKQVHDLIDLLAPIAHKILWALPGNHEDRTKKHAGIDPMEWLCDKLNIPYVDDAVHATIWWRGHCFNFFNWHGTSGSQLKGTKLNAVQRPAKFMEHVHFIIMGHLHDKITNPVPVIVRNYKTFTLELKPQYLVLCPSFLGYFGTYASKAAMEPGINGVTACEIYPNGEYKTDTW